MIKKDTKNIVALISMTLIIFLLISGGTFSYLSWSSSTEQRTNISSLNIVGAGYNCSIDGGGDITGSEVSVMPSTCTNLNHVIKREIRPSISIMDENTVYLDLWLTIDELGSYLSGSNNFKYALTSSDTSCSSDVITSGTFTGLTAGKRVSLLDSTSYVPDSANFIDNDDVYYLWIWLDAAETEIPPMDESARSFQMSLGGNCSNDSTDISTIPVCRWEGFENSNLGTGATTNISLVCVDNYLEFSDSDISTSDITLSNSVVSLQSDSVTKTSIDNGYRYTFVVQAGSTSGNTTFTLNAGAVSNTDGTVNEAAVSKTLNVNGVVSISDVDVTVEDKERIYNGQEIVPEVSVSYNGVTLDEGTDYSVAYSDNINAGTATITITGNDNNYSGTTTETFVISERPTTVIANTVYNQNGVPTTEISCSGDNLIDGHTVSCTVTNSTITAAITDNSNNAVSDNYLVTITDAVLPLISVASTASGEWTNSKDTITNTITFSDVGSGINASTLKYSTDGITYTTLINTNTSSFTHSITDTDNIAIDVMYYKICDIKGNCNISSTLIRVDTVPPELEKDGLNLDIDFDDNSASISIDTTKMTDEGIGNPQIVGYLMTDLDTCPEDGYVSSSSSLGEKYTFNELVDESYICVKLKDGLDNVSYYKTSQIIIFGENEYEVFEYTGDYQIYTVPEDGYYFIEAYGAQGGDAYNISGGKGGYTSGYVYMNNKERLYIYVGGEGEDGVNVSNNAASGGYNGGGNGYVETTAYYVSGGGGATDIRYFGSNTPTDSDLIWDSTLGLNSRIMVAAGGGGVAYNTSTYKTDIIGDAGGLIGKEGHGVATTAECYASGGTQKSVGSSGTLGSFGKGASEVYASRAGGGGGYYGGNTNCYSAGGGSSFISGYAGVNAITSSTDRTHTYDTLHYSKKYFLKPTMNSAVHSGNGYVKISYYGPNSPERKNDYLDNVRYIKECMNQNSVNSYNIMVEFQAIYKGKNVAKGLTAVLYDSSGTSITQNSSHPYSYITDGDITTSNYSYGTTYNGEQCFVVDLQSEYALDEVASWGYWGDSRINNGNVIYVSSDNETWIEIINNGKAESSDGKRINAYQVVNDEDTIAPVITVSNSSGTSWTSSSSVISYSITDVGGSGINTDSIKYGYYTSSISSSFAPSSTTVGADGIITSASGSGTWSYARHGRLYIKACDNAGNCTVNSDIYLRIKHCYKLNYISDDGYGYTYYTCYSEPDNSSTKVMSVQLWNGSNGYSHLMLSRYKTSGYWYSTYLGCYIYGGTPDSTGYIYYSSSSC